MYVRSGDVLSQANSVCIPTNGHVESGTGETEMSGGISLEIALAFPEISLTLGRLISDNGNVPQLIKPHNNGYLINFPVKHGYVRCSATGDNVVEHMSDQFKEGQVVPGFYAKADLDLIKESAERLVALADEHNLDNICLPRVGCGLGELNWNDVMPVISPILDSRFTVYFFNK